MRRDPLFIVIGCVFGVMAVVFGIVSVTQITPPEPACGPGGIDNIGCGGGRSWTLDATVAAVGAGVFLVLAIAAFAYGGSRGVR